VPLPALWPSTTRTEDGPGSLRTTCVLRALSSPLSQWTASRVAAFFSGVLIFLRDVPPHFSTSLQLLKTDFGAGSPLLAASSLAHNPVTLENSNRWCAFLPLNRRLDRSFLQEKRRSFPSYVWSLPGPPSDRHLIFGLGEVTSRRRKEACEKFLLCLWPFFPP